MILYFTRAIELGSSLLFVGLIARYLGKEGFGEYARISASINLLAMIMNFGLTIILIREIARRQLSSEKLVGSVSLLRLLLILLVFAAILIYLWLAHESEQAKKAILYYALAQAVFVQATIYHGVFLVFQKAEYQAIVFSIEKSVLIGALLLVIRLDLGFLAVFGVILLARMLNCALAYFYATTRFVKPSYTTNLGILRFLALESAPLGLTILLRESKGKTGTLLVAALMSTIQAGLFEGALRFIEILFLIPKVLTEALFPTLSAALVTSRAMFITAYQRSLKFFMILSVLPTLLLGLLADQLVVMILGPEFGEAAIALRVMSGSIVFIFFNTLFSSILAAMGKQRLETSNLCVSLVIAVGLLIVLVPSYGSLGAGLAYLVGESILFLLNSWLISKTIHTPHIWQLGIRPLLSGAIVTVIIAFLRRQGVHVIPLVGFSSLIYMLVLFLSGAITKDEMVTISSAFQQVTTSR